MALLTAAEIDELERRAKAAPTDFDSHLDATWAFIEVASPTKILALLAHIRDQDTALAEARELLPKIQCTCWDNRRIILDSECSCAKAKARAWLAVGRSE